MIEFRTRIVKIEERTRAVWRSSLGKDAQFDTVSDGWWITLEGSVSICIGNRKPESLREGDVYVRIDMGERR